ncbi:hypothetical protein OF83DRAFT_1167281 [Amylostereum chailletii]|nr:hypothetical protein OF83DRAFT_1167281 [Amylostereum chailletii]
MTITGQDTTISVGVDPAHAQDAIHVLWENELACDGGFIDTLAAHAGQISDKDLNLKLNTGGYNVKRISEETCNCHAQFYRLRKTLGDRMLVTVPEPRTVGKAKLARYDAVVTRSSQLRNAVEEAAAFFLLKTMDMRHKDEAYNHIQVAMLENCALSWRTLDWKTCFGGTKSPVYGSGLQADAEAAYLQQNPYSFQYGPQYGPQYGSQYAHGSQPSSQYSSQYSSPAARQY